jgi:hypothetical protein
VAFVFCWIDQPLCSRACACFAYSPSQPQGAASTGQSCGHNVTVEVSVDILKLWIGGVVPSCLVSVVYFVSDVLWEQLSIGLNFAFWYMVLVCHQD